MDDDEHMQHMQRIRDELDALRLARQDVTGVTELIRIRNRQGELTQEYWRLLRQRGGDDEVRRTV